MVNYGALGIKGFRSRRVRVSGLLHSGHLCPIFVFIGNHWMAQEIPRGGGNVQTGKKITAKTNNTGNFLELTSWIDIKGFEEKWLQLLFKELK